MPKETIYLPDTATTLKVADLGFPAPDWVKQKESTCVKCTLAATMGWPSPYIVYLMTTGKTCKWEQEAQS